MNFALQPFQSREAYQIDYAVPPDDLFDLSVVPVAPVLLSVEVGELVFRTVAGATAYRVYRRSSGPAYVQVGSDITATEDPTITFADAGITAPAFYRVRAINAVGPGPNSNVLFLEEPDISPCIIFDDLTWDSPYTFTSDGAAASGTVAGSSFGLDTSTPGGFEAGSESGYIRHRGTITYTGPAFICCISGVLTGPVDTQLNDDNPKTVSHALFEVVIGGVSTVLSTRVKADGSPRTFSQSFPIPECLTPTTIRIEVALESGVFGGTGITNDATVANVEGVISGCSPEAVPSAITGIQIDNVTTFGFRAQWTTNANASWYELDIATDLGFTSLVAPYDSYSTTFNNSIDVTGLSAGTTYYLRIRGTNAFGDGVNSSTVTVNTSP